MPTFHEKKNHFGDFVYDPFFGSIIFFYFNSNNEKKLIEKKQVELIEKEKIEINDERIESLNTIEDVSYSAKDTRGNNYFLQADQGTIDQNESNYIFLKSVKATINLKNYKLIEISSDFGKYNINNYDTIFSKNVIITYLDNKIKGDYLDFSLDKNLMVISKGVIEVEIDTRAIKIFMYEENNKVSIKSLN